MTETANIADRLAALGLVLPEPLQLPPGVEIPFAWARLYGDHVYVSGHGPVAADGSLQGPFGRVGADVSLADAQRAARSATLAMPASLQREVGDLDRVAVAQTPMSLPVILSSVVALR